MGADEEILHEFLVEGRENLDRLERELVGFERDGATEESISAIFRTVHTVKGTAGFFGFERLQSLAHVAETLLAKIRDGELPLTTDIVSAQLAVVDACRLMFDWVEQPGELGKQVRLELDGKETGLDRSVLEAIKDPLTHIIRNAIDHGIETPDVRLASGKPAEGLLRLRALHEGGHVLVEIADDGAGIDPERVLARALERNIVTLERAAKLTIEEAQALVLAPGFSTAETVTNISGRGVGMDVVKTNIERLGGAVQIESAPGRGT